MKDRSILSALYDGEIHSPFRERCELAVSESQELKDEYDSLQILSTRLLGTAEPDFQASKAQALEALLEKLEGHNTVSIGARGFWLTWPMAAAAALILCAGALTAGYSLKSSGFDLAWNQAPELKTQEYLTLNSKSVELPEIRVSVPKKFTLPNNSQGQLLLSSFEGGR